MAKYRITQVVSTDPVVTSEKEVDGEPIHFAGFEAFQFFSHKDVVSDLWGNYDDHRITEVSSGCSIGGGFTHEEALAKAHQNMAKQTPETFQELINNFNQLQVNQTEKECKN